MGYRVVRTDALDRDLDLIFDHLLDSYLALNADDSDAFDRAVERLDAIHASMERLIKPPYQGTLREEFGAGVRQVTKDRAIFYFTVHEDVEEVRVLAAFYGGQDHKRHMLKRLLADGQGDS